MAAPGLGADTARVDRAVRRVTAKSRRISVVAARTGAVASVAPTGPTVIGGNRALSATKAKGRSAKAIAVTAAVGASGTVRISLGVTVSAAGIATTILAVTVSAGGTAMASRVVKGTGIVEN